MDTQHIETVLRQLNDLYIEQDLSQTHLVISQELLCKMAALELCAWLEDTYDKWISHILNQNLSSLIPANTGQTQYEKYSEYFNGWEKAVNAEIQKTHGLSYHEHFRKLLVKLLGEFQVLKLENKIGLQDIDVFAQNLKQLHDYRGILAHQSIPNILIQRTFDTPNIIFQKFRQISPILEQFELHLFANINHLESKK